MASGVISIGNYANHSTSGGFGIGQPGNIAIGANSLSNGMQSIVIGNNSKVTSQQGLGAIVLGNNITVSTVFSGGDGAGFYTNAIRFGATDVNDGEILYLSTNNYAGEKEILRGALRTTTTYLSIVGGSGTINPTQITYKTFVIDHPKKPDNYLVHACLEGPEAGVYYRGKAQVSDRFVEVELPDYVDALATDFTVHVTPIFDEENDNDGHYKVTEVKNGKFRMYGPPGRVNWIVYGSRGAIEVEPERSKTNVNGDGPYKWI